MVRNRFFVPRVERLIGNVFGEGVLVVIRGIKGGGLLLFDHQLPGGTLHIDVALKDRQIGGLGRGIDAEVRGMIEGDALAREVQVQIIFAQPIDIGHALHQIHLRHALAGIGEAQLAELDRGVRGQAKRAAILELNLGAAIGAGVQLGALGDRKVGESAFKTNPRVLVDLHRSLNVAEPDNAGLRIGQSW